MERPIAELAGCDRMSAPIARLAPDERDEVEIAPTGRWLVRGHRGHGDPLSAGPDLHERLFADLPSLDEIERRYLLHVIEQVGGNRTRAAEVLGIDRRTLYRMAERFGIDLKDDAGSGAA